MTNLPSACPKLPEGLPPPTWRDDTYGVALYRADCLDIMPVLASVDAVVTDPPYGHNNNNNDMIAKREAIYGGANRPRKVPESEYRPILNDGPEANDLFQRCAAEYARLLKPGCCCCCCCGGGGGPDPQFARWALWLDAAIPFKHMIVWDKGPMGMGHHYRRSYEVVLVAQKPGAACKWYDTTNCIENILRPGPQWPKIIPQKDEHPTVKPVGLMEHFIGLHTAPGDLVLDPFMGSGTTGVAAVRQGRAFVGIELDSGYFAAAVTRIRQAIIDAQNGELFATHTPHTQLDMISKSSPEKGKI